ncbi:alpha-2B adrenergic receptor-like [Pollicipes pollicipes]|uniref:alpha-2B adrenergic receptor-like n=1 Tax=Pollicipes pollicipes TaxID=41117 RepID=UPI0018849A6B|nr:alpha-2B adrenergic receptor-like [Pollicipes pollicipes]
MSAAAEAIIGFIVFTSSAVPVVAILRRRQLREACMYQLLASMAAAEMTVGAISTLLGSLRLLHALPPGWVCLVLVFSRASIATSTVVSFLMLSLERYVTVVHGMRYFDIVTDRRQLLLVAASWLTAALLSVFGMTLRARYVQVSDT